MRPLIWFPYFKRLQKNVIIVTANHLGITYDINMASLYGILITIGVLILTGAVDVFLQTSITGYMILASGIWAAIDYVPWGFLGFLLAYNVIAFIASTVGLLRLKNSKFIAISYIVVTIGIFVSAIIKTAYFTAFNPLIFWCICNFATYAATMFCLVRLEANAEPVESQRPVVL